MQTYLEHLTDEELSVRLNQLQAMADETQKLLASGQRGEFVGTYIRHGRHFRCYKNEVGLNRQNQAIEQTKLEISNRSAAR